MSRIHLLFLIFIFNSGVIYSQDNLFALHPSVGDTIDREEKLNYALFPEFKISDFKYCYILHSGNRYRLYSSSLKDSLTIKDLDTSDIRLYLTNINTIDEIDSINAVTDSAKNKNISLNINPTGQPKILKFIDPETKRQIAIDGRKKSSMKALAELRGLTGEKKERFMNYGQ